MIRIVSISVVVLSMAVTVLAQERPLTLTDGPATVMTTPLAAATAEDALQLQVVILKSQLAQALGAAAKCEVDGPQAAKVAAEANAAAQALVSALDARGLRVDPATNAIVPKPKAAAASPAAP